MQLDLRRTVAREVLAQRVDGACLCLLPVAAVRMRHALLGHERGSVGTPRHDLRVAKVQLLDALPARVLDLDDVSAEVRQHSGGRGAGEEGGDVEDADVVQGC